MPLNVLCTPICSPSRAVSATSAAWSKAFVGMQPRCRQVPPSLSCSIKTTERPSCDARNAQAYPPLPPPKITMSCINPPQISLVRLRASSSLSRGSHPGHCGSKRFTQSSRLSTDGANCLELDCAVHHIFGKGEHGSNSKANATLMRISPWATRVERWTSDV